MESKDHQMCSIAKSSSQMASPNLSYERVEALADSNEDWPGPRCGHTLTPISANNSRQLVLFGGTNLVDRNSLLGINLDGVTNSVHCFDVSTRRWRRLNTCGDAPSPRAWHAAATIRTYLIITGGINQGRGNCDMGVYVLDIASDDHRWRRLNVRGVTPGPRYGHVMGIASQRWLVIFGGAYRNLILSDAWALDFFLWIYGIRPDRWHLLNQIGNLPVPRRMFASACIGRSGEILLFGGRDSSWRPLGDVYALTVNSITLLCRWTIIDAGVAPSPRYLHSAVFDGTRMHVFGGAVTWNTLVDGEAIVAALNIETGEWLESNLPENSANRSLIRSLHAAAYIGGCIYVYGGRRSGDLLLEDLLVSGSPHPPTPERRQVCQFFYPTLRGQPRA